MAVGWEEALGPGANRWVFTGPLLQRQGRVSLVGVNGAGLRRAEP